MPEPSIPAARLEASVSARIIARLRPVGRAALWTLTKIVPPMLIVGAIGLAVFGIVHCDRTQRENKLERCVAVSMTLGRVERIVRDGDRLRVYVLDAGTKALMEYGFPAKNSSSSVFIYLVDVPPGQPMRIESTAQLDPSEWCNERIVVHIRSARDIE